MPGKEKDDKPPPAMGPGSKIKGLIDALRKHLIVTEDKKKRQLLIDFTSVGFKTLPVEIPKNEEVCDLATRFLLQFNKLKKLPGNISELRFLRYVDMRSNQMSSIPASFFKIETLEYLDCSCNTLKSLPGTIKTCQLLHTLDVHDNRLKALPKTINKCSALQLLYAKDNQIRKMNKTLYELGAEIDLSYNKLTDLPTAKIKSPALRRLDVSHNQIPV
ncbi:plant intracellular Ras-group-related LRR protein 4, partial [Aplysia californica]|uniref:Plant intracellular Ras-group-related LRR protein 4 n=1 Tax=Aplysia californica TaxID=6500 RepID=A0ABM1A456_APLCA